MKTNFNYKKIKKFIIKKTKKYKERFSKVKKFILLVLGYGFLINTMLWSIFGFIFTFLTLVGYGILYYLIKEEFTEWFRRLFPDRMRMR